MPATPDLNARGSGVLLHLTSLPGNYGCGGLGPPAARFAGLLASAGQAWWQMLPVGPPGYGNCPYMATSSFALSPSLLSLEELGLAGRLTAEELSPIRTKYASRVDFLLSEKLREPRLRRAAERFEAQATAEERTEFERFRFEEASWLEDYALFCALKEATVGDSWTTWNPGVRARRPEALERARQELAPAVRRHCYLQFELARQWSRLRAQCRELGLGLIGDVPIFVAHESADVWAHPEAFHLDEQGRSTVVAGVPPDYFSPTGQRWGHPLYRWEVLREDGYAWWIQRLRRALSLFDAVRLDHFIGFVRYWEIPVSCPTAVDGRWVEGPGEHFFATVNAQLGPAALIAEDLGVVTPEVTALRERFGFPGMRVLQFAFGGDPRHNPHLPHLHEPRGVVYTGTHDNDTTLGWYRDLLRRAGTEGGGALREREYFHRYLRGDPGGSRSAGGAEGPAEMPWEMIRLAQSSCANLAVIPAQDLLGLGSEARMNIPSNALGNWEWRMEENAFTPAMAERLRGLAGMYGRLAAGNGQG